MRPTLTDRAIVVIGTPVELRSQIGPPSVRYVWVESLGVLFRWAANSPATDDGVTAIVPNAGGFLGAWLLVRTPVTPTGDPTALTNADQHINVGGGSWYSLPVSTLSAPHTVTIDLTNAAAGDEIEITRYDVTGYTLTVANSVGTTILVMPAGSRSYAVASLGTADWVHRRSGLML